MQLAEKGNDIKVSRAMPEIASLLFVLVKISLETRFSSKPSEPEL
jgi:hypothetical protein